MERDSEERRTGGMKHSGGDFAPRSAEDVIGRRVTLKICETCGKGFFRDALQRDCAQCVARAAEAAADRQAWLRIARQEMESPEIEPRVRRTTAAGIRRKYVMRKRRGAVAPGSIEMQGAHGGAEGAR